MKLGPIRILFLIGIMLACGGGFHIHAQCVDAQIVAVSDAKVSASAKPTVDKDGVYEVGGEVIPPKLLHCTEPAYSAQPQKFHISDDSTLSLVVYTDGKPEDIVPVSKIGLGLDENAVTAVKDWRFQPAILNDQPVSTRIQLIVSFHYCENPTDCEIQLAEREALAKLKAFQTGGSSSKSDSGPRRLVETDGVYEEQGSTGTIAGFTFPKMVHHGSFKLTKAARKAKLRGFCILSLVVDAKGTTEDVQVVKPVGMGMDENAVAMLQQSRFKPATLNGEPIALRTDLIVNIGP